MPKKNTAKLKTNKDREKVLITTARACLGRPYKYGAHETEAPKRFDCSSFLQYVYRRIGVELPRVSIEQAMHGRVVSRPALLKVGDAIFTHGSTGRYNPRFPQGIGHVVLYVGDGMVIHAEGVRHRKVIEEPLEKILARRDVVVMKRYL